MDNLVTIEKKVDQGSVDIQSNIFDKHFLRQEWQRSNSSLEGVLSYMRKYGTPEQKAALTA